MLRWLHISDLHLNDDNFSSARLRDELPSFLRNKRMKCDYVFCTGDIRSANVRPNSFTEDMADYMRNICHAVGAPIERLFIVPGNHDVNIFAEGREDAIKHIVPYDGYYKPDIGHIDTVDLEKLQSGKEDFVDFLSELYDTDRLGLYTDYNNPHFSIETPDFNVLHVDSTLVYSQSGKATDLLVGLEKLYTVVRKLNLKKPTILLTHYPITSLLQDERKLLSNVLQKNNVRLWLAGHEHDHNLQKMKYLDSLQSGELHYETDANATILIGEYDSENYQCRVCAYTWFPEGWAEYPIIDLDGEEVGVYEFQLKPVGIEGHSKELIACQKANSYFYNRMPDKVERNLIPKIHSEGTYETISTLLSMAWNTNCPHIVLLADGGMGKTTMLLDYCKTTNTPTLYVSAEQLASMGMDIIKYCARCVFKGDIDLLEKCLTQKHRQPTLIIFIDGMNEVDGISERKFIQEIQRLSFLDGVQILISSRSDFTVRYSLPTFRKSELCALSKTEIKDFFSEEEWNNIVKSEVLTRLLSNPMMVTIYKEICSVVNDSKNLHFLNWRFPIMCEADLFHNYYVAQQALLTLRGQVDGYKMLLSQVCIDEILPNIAYCYESSFRMNMEDEEFRKLLTGMLDNVVIENAAIHAIRQYYREASGLSLEPYQVIDFLTQEMRLLYMNQGTTAFPHQMFRDYLSAKYIVKQTNSKKNVLALWNERPIPFSIISNIRQIDKQYWHHTAQCVRQEAAKVANVSVLVQNLFDAFPSNNKDNVADFSELDLRNVKLPNSALQTSRISLKDAIIDNVTLGISMGMPICHKHLTLSSDKEFLATWADKRIYVFSLRQSTAPYVFDFGQDLSKMVFVENRLFVLSGKLYVFVYKNGWVFSGEIGQEDGICYKLKSIIVGNNAVHLYYPNREVIYSLTDFTRKTINQGKDIYLNPAQGHDISMLNRYEKKQFDKSHGEIDKVGDENFCAISYADGRLILEHENETIGILARGKARLKDATISGDGSKAITLSYEVFGGRRRVQLWNLNDGSKLEELTCPNNVDSIHLSENGDWMLGKMFRHGTWVYDVRLHKEQVFEEYFLSSNRGKIFCKDDCVVRKEEGKVFLYNLRTGKSSIIDSPVADPSLICILRDNSIAAVNNKGNVAKIRSFRDQSLLTFNGGYSTIESIGLFEEQPFIAVALANGNLDMYHTGNGAVLRHLQLPNKNSMMVVHPQKTIIVESDGHHILKTHYYFEKYSYYGKRMGWWKEHPYHGPKNIIDGDILDIGFNVQNDQIVAVLSNGRIMFCSDDWTDYKYSFYIITAFDVAAYDFSEVQCSEELKDVLRRNKAL